MDDLEDEPPSPPPLRRSIGFGYNGRNARPQTPPMRRRPSPLLPGDEWIEQFHAPTPRELFRTSSSGSWSASTEEYEEDPSWWFSIPEKLRTDSFWKHMFDQSEFFLVKKKIEPSKREAIDTIMRLLPIGYKSIYNTATRRQPLKSPFPKVVNVAFVKQYVTNMTPLTLTPEDRYRFEMMIMNFLMFAPMKVLENYITRLSRRGGKTRKLKYKV